MPRPAPDPDALRAWLSELVGPVGRIVPIESGTAGTSYRVDTAAGRFAAKAFFEHADLLLGPSRQYRVLEAVAAADIAPQPVAFDDVRGLLVTLWIDDGRPARPEELAVPERLHALVPVLRTLHAIDCDIPDYRPHDYLARYIDAAGGALQLSRRDRERRAEALDLAAALDAISDARGLCHNDLTADNCFVGRRIRLIDFDFAVRAPLLVDLASLAEMNRFDEKACRELLAAGFDDGENRAPAFAGARRLISLLAHFWARASADAGTAIVDQYRMIDD